MNESRFELALSAKNICTFSPLIFFLLPNFAPSPLMGEGWDEGENQDRDPSLM
jgi:hypothetical protein